MRAAAAAECRRSSAPWRSSAGVGQIGAPVVRLRYDLAVGHESDMRNPPGVDGAVLGGGAECTAWRRLDVAARRQLERVRAAKVAYGLNRLTQQRGEVGMWLTGARIERGVMQVAPAARSIRGSRRRLREGLLQWSSGVWIPRIDSGWCCGSVQKVREVRGSPGMSNWLEIGVYRGWGARRDSGDAVQESERGRLRKSPRAEAELLRRSAGPGVRWRGRRTAARVLCAAERGEAVARFAGWRR